MGNSTMIISEVKKWPPSRMPRTRKSRPKPKSLLIKAGPDNTLIIEERDQGSKSVPQGSTASKTEKKRNPEAIIIKVGPDNKLIIEEMPPERF